MKNRQTTYKHNRHRWFIVGLLSFINIGLIACKVEEKIEQKVEEKIEQKVEEKKYSDDIIELAKDIDMQNPLEDNVKKFQIALKLFSENDIEFGFLESITILAEVSGVNSILCKSAIDAIKSELFKSVKGIFIVFPSIERAPV